MILCVCVCVCKKIITNALSSKKYPVANDSYKILE